MNGVIHVVTDVDEDVSTVIHAASLPSLLLTGYLRRRREGRSANRSVGMGFMSPVAALESRKPSYNADVPDRQSGTNQLPTD